MSKKLKKILRFVRIYGVLRTCIKGFGRARPAINLTPFFKLIPFKKDMQKLELLDQANMPIQA